MQQNGAAPKLLGWHPNQKEKMHQLQDRHSQLHVAPFFLFSNPPSYLSLWFQQKTTAGAGMSRSTLVVRTMTSAVAYI